MKLSSISEAKNKLAIHDSAQAIGDLMDFVKDAGDLEENKALNQFLATPSVKTWDNAKWVIDSATKKAVGSRPLAERIKLWNSLKGLTSLVVVAAVYDVDPKQAKGTPLQRVALNKPIRDKYKKAMGPQGYISTMANAGNIQKSKLRDMLKTTAKNNVAITKSIKHDIPGIKQVNRF